MVRKTKVPKATVAKRENERAKGILTRVNSDGLRVLRILAIERDTTLQALSIEALNDLLAKHGKPRAIKNPLLDD